MTNSKTIIFIIAGASIALATYFGKDNILSLFKQTTKAQETRTINVDQINPTTHQVETVPLTGIVQSSEFGSVTTVQTQIGQVSIIDEPKTVYVKVLDVDGKTPKQGLTVTLDGMLDKGLPTQRTATRILTTDAQGIASSTFDNLEYCRSVSDMTVIITSTKDYAEVKQPIPFKVCEGGNVTVTLKPAPVTYPKPKITGSISTNEGVNAQGKVQTSIFPNLHIDLGMINNTANYSIQAVPVNTSLPTLGTGSNSQYPNKTYTDWYGNWYFGEDPERIFKGEKYNLVVYVQSALYDYSLSIPCEAMAEGMLNVTVNNASGIETMKVK